MKSRRLFALALALAAPVAIALAATASASPPDALQAAHAAAARYHSVEQALAAGYVPASPCEQLAGAGGMGIHYLNPALVGDPSVDPANPEILLYVPKENGNLELVGVEYFVVDRDQNTTTDDDRPSLFGRGFDGPMAGHAPDMPVHYDLHVWLYEANPSGTFAVWNPNVSCP